MKNQQLIYVLHCLIKSVEKGDFPSLQTVCLLSDRKTGGILLGDNKLFSKLKQNGVDICTPYLDLEKIMIDAGLA